MKLSKTTVDILKNFASINQNILIKEGNKLTTRTVAKNVFVEATVEDEFPQEFGIYNLSEFLGVVSLFSEPVFNFQNTTVEVSQGKNKVHYGFASPEVLDYPDKNIKMPDAEVQFELSEENLKSLLKAASVLGSTDLKISGDGTQIVCTVLDPKNPSSNTFSVEVGETEHTFDCFLKIENLKMPMGIYEASLSSKKITRFKSKTLDYTIYIAAEKNSTWA